MNKFIILISGIPGVGKTTLAQYLNKQLKIPMVSKDIVKEKLYDTIGFKSRDEKVKLGIGAMEVMYHFADNCLNIDIPIILENNFENISKPKLLELIKKHNCKVLNLILNGDPEVIYERFIERDLSPKRHRGHVINTQYPEPEGEQEKQTFTQITSEQFTSIMESLEKRGMVNFDIGDDIIHVDTTDFNSISYDDILLQVKNIINKYKNIA